MKAILRIGSSNELLVVENRKLCYCFSLRTGSILTDAYKYLANLPLTELDVIMTPVIKAPEGVTKDYEISGFEIDGRVRKGYISYVDIEKIKELTRALGLNSFRVFNMFEVLKLIGQRVPSIICGKFVKNFVYYVFVDKRGIVEFSVSQQPQLDKLTEMASLYDVENVITEKNNVLSGLVRSMYDNITDMDDDELSRVYVPLCVDAIKPGLSVMVDDSDYAIEELGIMDDGFNAGFIPDEEEPLGFEEEFIEEEELFDDFIEEEDYIDEPVSEPVRESKAVKSNKQPRAGLSRNKLISRLLDLVGCLLVVLLSLTLVANKEVPADTGYLNEKIAQVESVVKPMRANLDYMNNYIASLSDGKNTDNQIVEKISAIKVDGILSEIALSKKDVGIALYLSNEKDIDKFTEELNKIVKVKNVDKMSKMELGGDPLTKFVISATVQ
ncbi:hypothetical protein UT300012_23890 [Paraclostridium bifermentans]